MRAIKSSPERPNREVSEIDESVDFWISYTTNLAEKWGLKSEDDPFHTRLWTDGKLKMIYVKEGHTLSIVLDDGDHGWCKFQFDPDGSTSLYAHDNEGVKLACEAWEKYEEWRGENEKPGRSDERT